MVYAWLIKGLAGSAYFDLRRNKESDTLILFSNDSGGNAVDEGYKMRITYLIPICLIFGALTGCANFPRIYSGESVHGWVVDAKTKQPIEDVLVLEIWELYGHQNIFEMTGDHNGYVHIAETLTDENGYYAFPEWGPKLTTDGAHVESNPRLVFYKFGYSHVFLSNRVSGNPNRDNRISEHSGEKIEMEKHEGSVAEYEKKVRMLHGVLNLSSYRKAIECRWAEVPRFTSEMIKLSRYFKENRVGSGGFPSLESIPKYKCGNRDEILKDYLK